MNPNYNQQQQPPIYTTKHYIHDPQANAGNNNNQSHPPAPAYPYYSNNQPRTTITYVNDRPNYGQQPQSYAPPNANYNGPPNQNYNGPPHPNYNQPPPNPNYNQPPNQNYNQPPHPNYNQPPNNRNDYNNPVRGGGGPAGGGGIEKTNVMSNESPFHDPARRHEQVNPSRRITSTASSSKDSGESNKTLNLSEESPFHSIYSGYHYPSQIDPTKRITTQNAGARSTDNKSLNLSDESPFFSTYGHYHYPSQIDPQKRITEMPKSSGSLGQTNEMSNENPFSNYRPPSPRNYAPGPGPNSYSPPNNDSNRNYNNNPVPTPYRSNQEQQPPPNYYNHPQPSSMRPPSPPVSQPPVRPPAQKPNPSGPQDKTSLNMSPDNPFAATYGGYHYPSAEEIKAQKRSNERNARFADQQPVNNNRPGGQPSNQMSEYPEAENKDVIAGKGNTKFTRFEVNF
ncbi:unnamed protein product [Adineta steineri]|uniref:Uncharacterized protein n=1 Tax=Adineta steineri TaxID=433720 RepID=A0A814X855_9BILA|nr:unnamed protein product [Adineta steineri]